LDTNDPAILEVAELGIAGGVGNDKFEPAREIARQEAAVMLNRTWEVLNGRLDLPESLSGTSRAYIPMYFDKKPASWASEAVQKVNLLGVMTGTSRNSFSPGALYTREQAFVTATRLLSALKFNIPYASYLANTGAKNIAGLTDLPESVQISTNNPDVAYWDNEGGISTGKLGFASVTISDGNFRLPIRIEVLASGNTPPGAVRYESDFTGAQRIRYENDVAFEAARLIENKIGIRIFYLPEYSQRSDALFTYDDFKLFDPNAIYLERVLVELDKMNNAFDLYPEGFLKELVSEKSHKTEIVLCPAFTGILGAPGTVGGQFVYDYGSGGNLTDIVYYAGVLDSRTYAHEIGHMIASASMIKVGHSAAAARWEKLNEAAGENDFVSAYATVNRTEDQAETWAALWHETDRVLQQAAGSEILRNKIRYLTELINVYDSISVNDLPWKSLL
jgi:hypothetical protein